MGGNGKRKEREVTQTKQGSKTKDVQLLRLSINIKGMERKKSSSLSATSRVEKENKYERKVT